MNKEPTHFLTIMNNGKEFPRFDGMACSYSDLTISASIRAQTSQKVLRPSKTLFIRK